MAPLGLRLYILGEAPGELTIMAEIGHARDVERVRLDAKKHSDLTRGIRDLRSSMEAGYPPFLKPELKKLGQSLFDLVITGKIRAIYDGVDKQALVPLEIVAERAEVTFWPWEFLFDPRHNFFICQEFYPISRALMGVPIVQELTAGLSSSARLLVVIGTPDKDVSVDDEVRWIQELFGEFDTSLPSQIIVKRARTDDELDTVLSHVPTEIVHFIGHAGFDHGQDEAYLSLLDDDGNETRVSAERLGQILLGRKIKLVFLNACRTAVGSDIDPPSRSSLAAALLQRGVPAVVAAQAALPDSAAHLFSKAVYFSLRSQDSISMAIRNGRRRMTVHKESKYFDWGIPVLYAYDPRVRLFGSASAASPSPVGDLPPPVGPLVHGFDIARPVSLPGSMAKISNQPKSEKATEIMVSGVSENKIDQMVRAIKEVHGDVFRVQERDGTFTVRAIVPDGKQEADGVSIKARVAFVDLDAKVGLLPSLVQKANEAQNYFEFEVAYYPAPAGGVREFRQYGLQTYLPHFDDALSDAPEQLGVDWVCCLTRYPLAGERFANFFSVELSSNTNVIFLSTFGVPEYAKRAGSSFSKAVLQMCLGMLVACDGRWNVDYHPKTVGCMMDKCMVRSDLVQSLRHSKFDHEDCRSKVTDAALLRAVDILLALPETELLESAMRHPVQDTLDSFKVLIGPGGQNLDIKSDKSTG